MARIILSGKLTELVGGRHWGEGARYMAQVSLAREPVDKPPVADRYYCCGFYVSKQEAATLRPGQPIRITIEQD